MITARRRHVTVTDDGIGIADLQRLLTVAESGWDAETIEREHPFGVGFLAAVYAGERITVESLGSRLSIATAVLLAFQTLSTQIPGRRRSRLSHVHLTGDADLLYLHPFCEIPIVTPAQFIMSVARA